MKRTFILLVTTAHHTKNNIWCSICCMALLLLATTMQAQNYTISTAGNVLTITDLSGNGDVLAVTENGSGIRFDVTNAARTYSLNGGAATSFPVTVSSLATFTSIVVNAAGGTDEVSITGFTTSLPSLTGITVNGGAGDLTFTGLLTLSGAASYALALNSDANLTLSQSASGGSPVYCTATATVNVTIGAPGWNTNGGSFTSSGANFSMISNPITTSGGDVTLNHAGYNVTLQFGGIQTGGGAFMAQGADMTVDGGGLNTSWTGNPGGNATLTATGNILLKNAGASTGGGNFMAQGVDITISGGGLNTSRSSNPGGDVTLTGTGNVVVKDNGAVTGGGKCEIIATGNVQVIDAGVSTCGDVTDGNFSSQGVDYTSGANGVQTCGGNVTLTHTGNVTAIAITQGGTFSSTGKTFNCINSGINTSKIGGMGGDVTLNHAGYNITLQNGGVQTGGGAFMAQGANMTVEDGGLNTSRTGNPGGNATLTATGNILLKIVGAITGGGTFMAQGVDITISDGGLNTSRSGNPGGDVTLTGTGNVVAKNSGIQTGGGKCQIIATGNVQVIDGGANTCGDVTDGNFSSQGVDYTSGANGVQTCGGNVTLTHTGNVTAIAFTQGGTFSSTGKNFNCINGGINTSKTGGMGGSVTLNHAGYNITFQNSGVQTGGGAFMAQGADITISDGGLNTSRSGFVGGNATLTHTGNVLVQNGGVQTGGGTFNSQGVDITIKDGGLNTARSGFSGGNVTLTHTGIVSVQGNGVQTGGGTFHSTGSHATVQDGGVNATGIGSSTVTMNHSGDVSLLSGGGIQANGNISLTANSLAIRAQVNTSGGTVIFNTPNGTSPIFSSTDVTGTALSFTAGSKLNIVVNGTTPGDGTFSTYTQLTVVGAVNLNGVSLQLSGSHVPVIGQVFTIVDNDGTDAITGTFTGLPQNGLIANFLGTSALAVISYTGGTGNDVTITVVSPPDYSITTTGNVLTITDNKNNGDVLEITEDGAGMIKFNVTNATRTYDLNGVTSSNLPYTHALAGITSIVVNTKGGADAINVGAFANTILPNLTINGGIGDDAVNFNGDLTFALNANLDVDLQDDDPTPGTDNVTVAANANLILSGTGTATVKVSKNVLVNAGGSIKTVNGDLTVEANQQGAATTGAFSGVTVTGAGSKLGCSGSGILMVKGKGGNSGTCRGVVVEAGGTITGGTAAVSVMGTGGSSASNGNYGVFVTGTNSQITSSGGNVSVTGTGGGTGTGTSSRNYGIYVQSAGQITAGGSGTVTVVGNGGTAAKGGFNHGVFVLDTDAQITSSGGNVSVTGTGGGSGAGSNNYGILVQSAGQITAGGSGTVTVVGNGGTAPTQGSNLGVFVLDTDARITSSGGNVSVTGTGGGSGTGGNYGVLVQNTGKITAGGNGTVTVVGNGGTAPTGTSNYGVFVTSTNSQITSSGGNVSVTGTGGGLGSLNRGVVVENAGQITAGGNGTVTVVGNGGTAATGSSNYGVHVTGTNSQITSSGGNVSVTGTGGGSGSSFNTGGVLVQSAQITAGGNGTVTVVGNGGTGSTGNNNYGVGVFGTDAKITSSGGNVSVTGTGGGSGAGTSNHGIFVLSAGQITAGGSGTVTVVGNGGTVTTGGNNHGVYVGDSDSKITSSGGNVSVTGTGGGSGTSNDNYGIYVNLAGQITAGMSGTVTVVGNGGTAPTGNSNIGVAVNGANSKITSSGGNVSVTGVEGGGPNGIGFLSVSNGQVTTVPSGDNIAIIANSMNIGADGVSTPTGNSVTLRPYTNGVQIDLGSVTDPIGGPLGLSDAELDRVTTGTLHIGDANTGHITVSTDITRSASTVINLTTGGAVNFNASALNSAGGNVNISAAGGVNPSATGIDVSMGATGILAFATGNDLNIPINGTAVDAQYRQLNAVGAVNLTGVDLVLSGSYTVVGGETFTIVNNDAADVIIGTFNGLAEGAKINNFLGSPFYARISYLGGTGNDVVISVCKIPVLTGCPTAQSTNVVTNTCSASVTYPAPTVDASPTAPLTYAFIGATTGNGSGTGSGLAFTVGVTTVTLTATNDCATGTATCQFTVTVSDNQFPTIICPTNIVRSNDPDQCSAVVTYNVTASDNCSASITQTVGQISGAVFPVGNTINSFVATDAAGNTATCSFSIRVLDTQAPMVACPANTTLGIGTNCAAPLGSYGLTNKSDNCSTAIFEAQSPVAGTIVTGHNTEQPVTLTATDGSGNTASCSFIVTLKDVMAPSITCPANIVRPTDLNLCSAVVIYATPIYSDNCSGGGASHTNGGISGSAFVKGISTVNWQATDGVGLTKTCSFTITVTDGQAPGITCPANIVRSNDAGQCSAVVAYPNPIASDNCSLPTTPLQWISGGTTPTASGANSISTFPKGATTVTWRATDGAGLTKTCTFRVTVNDTQAPTLTCPAAMSLSTATNTCSAVATYTNPTFTDNCMPTTGIATRISGLVSGSTFPLGNNNVVFQATDAAGNTRRCTMVVTVMDNQPPVINCPLPVVATGTGTPCRATVFYGSTTASDNCAGTLTPFLVTGLASGSIFPAGVTTNTFRAVAPNGQSSECSFTITVDCGSGMGNNGVEVRDADLSVQHSTHLDLTLAPNPALSTVTVSIEGVGAGGGTLQVYDAIGRLVLRQIIVEKQRIAVFQVDGSAFTPGLYRVNLRTETGMVTKTLVVVK